MELGDNVILNRDFEYHKVDGTWIKIYRFKKGDSGQILNIGKNDVIVQMKHPEPEREDMVNVVFPKEVIE